ncbi:MAG: hypothetical protein ABIJ28_02900 [Patescibacteria group bacterium]
MEDGLKRRWDTLAGLKITAKYAALCNELFFDFATGKEGGLEDLINESKNRKFYKCYEQIAKILEEKNVFHPIITAFYWLANGNRKKDLPLELTHNYIVMEDGIKVFNGEKEKVVISHSSCLIMPARIKKMEEKIAIVEQPEITVKNNSFVLKKFAEKKVRRIFTDTYPSIGLISIHQGLIIEPISELQHENLITSTQKILDLFNGPSK